MAQRKTREKLSKKTVGVEVRELLDAHAHGELVFPDQPTIAQIQGKLIDLLYALEADNRHEVSDLREELDSLLDDYLG